MILGRDPPLRGESAAPPGEAILKVQLDKFLFAANLLEGMYLSEAAQWAKAGEYRYIAFAIEQMLAKELEYESQPIADRPFRLPHHSLCARTRRTDLWSQTIVPMQLRYKARLPLAVDVVARLIEVAIWGPTPDRKDVEILRERPVIPQFSSERLQVYPMARSGSTNLGRSSQIFRPQPGKPSCNRDPMDRFLRWIL